MSAASIAAEVEGVGSQPVSAQRFKILFVTYTIIQNIIRNAMLVRFAPWTVQLYEIQTQENIHKYRYGKLK